jgi:hypothetical protein
MSPGGASSSDRAVETGVVAMAAAVAVVAIAAAANAQKPRTATGR